VFDLDGTLVDSYPAITGSLNAARALYALPPLDEPTVRASVGHGLESLIRRLVGPDRVEAGVCEFRRRYREIYESGTTALPGVPHTLAALRERGYRLSVASNKPASFSRPILESLALLEAFDTVEGPDTAGATKPDPRMIRRCLAGMDVAAAQAVYVGDMVLDAESGGRAGLPVLLLSGGSSDRGSLEATGLPLLDEFGELLELFRAACPADKESARSSEER
jgi:phosphoglycolate phosphatase